MKPHEEDYRWIQQWELFVASYTAFVNHLCSDSGSERQWMTNSEIALHVIKMLISDGSLPGNWLAVGLKTEDLKYVP